MRGLARKSKKPKGSSNRDYVTTSVGVLSIPDRHTYVHARRLGCGYKLGFMREIKCALLSKRRRLYGDRIPRYSPIVCTYILLPISMHVCTFGQAEKNVHVFVLTRIRSSYVYWMVGLRNGKTFTLEYDDHEEKDPS